MMYKNVSYNHGGERTLAHRETIQGTTFDDEIWTAISFSPDSNDNQSDFDIPFYIEPLLYQTGKGQKNIQGGLKLSLNRQNFNRRRASPNSILN